MEGCDKTSFLSPSRSYLGRNHIMITIPRKSLWDSLLLPCLLGLLQETVKRLSFQIRRKVDIIFDFVTYFGYFWYEILKKLGAWPCCTKIVYCPHNTKFTIISWELTFFQTPFGGMSIWTYWKPIKHISEAKSSIHKLLFLTFSQSKRSWGVFNEAKGWLVKFV